MKSLPAITTLALVLLAAHPAGAQLTQGNGPVQVDADSQDFTNSECVNIWRGNVEALQDTARLRTDQLKAFFAAKAKSGSSGNGCGDLLRMEAQGSVYYATPDQRVRGDNAVYEAASDTLTLTGDVVAVRGQNVIRGTRMVINTKTGEGHVSGAATGRNQPNRVRGVFYPNQSNAATASTKPAPAGQPR
jgi:lipopolysaccharide export system protein LptA